MCDIVSILVIRLDCGSRGTKSEASSKRLRYIKIIYIMTLENWLNRTCKVKNKYIEYSSFFSICLNIDSIKSYPIKLKLNCTEFFWGETVIYEQRYVSFGLDLSHIVQNIVWPNILEFDYMSIDSNVHRVSHF